MGNTRYTLQEAGQEEIASRLLYVSESIYEGDWPSLKHSHYFAELFYVRGGTGEFLVENDVVPVRPDDLLIVNPHVEHTEISGGGDPLDYIVLGVGGLSFSFGGNGNYSVHNFRAHREELLFYFRVILAEMQEKRQKYELLCQNLLEILLIHMMRHVKLSLEAVPDQKSSPECSKVKRYIDSNFAEEITLETLADKAHLNKYYLAHAFTKYYGLSPMSYLIEKRIQCSKELLESTDHSIAEIAQLSGFSSQSYFSQSFRKACGVSAGAYRKEMRKTK